MHLAGKFKFISILCERAPMDSAPYMFTNKALIVSMVSFPGPTQLSVTCKWKLEMISCK